MIPPLPCPPMDCTYVTQTCSGPVASGIYVIMLIHVIHMVQRYHKWLLFKWFSSAMASKLDGMLLHRTSISPLLPPCCCCYGRSCCMEMPMVACFICHGMWLHHDYVLCITMAVHMHGQMSWAQTHLFQPGQIGDPCYTKARTQLHLYYP